MSERAIEDGPEPAPFVLGPDGVVDVNHPLAGPGAALDIREAYRDMVLSRRIDTAAIALQRQGELGLWPSLLGQEAAQVGAARAVAPQDIVFPSYREHAVAWCRGVDPVRLMGLFRGTTMGGWDPRQHNFHLYTLVVGAQTLHAVGYAMGLVRRRQVGTGDTKVDRAVLVFIGDGALSQGEVNEALVWAGSMNLPVVFFCQNNQWAISAPFSVQSRVPAADRPVGFGIPGIRVDGNDVIATFAVVSEALQRARDGLGPSFIEAVTYRLNPHTTSDDSERYRSPQEEAVWAARDPIERVRLHLERNPRESDPVFFANLGDEEEALALSLREGCRALPDPDPLLPFEHTFGALTDELRQQREAHRAFVGSFEEGS